MIQGTGNSKGEEVAVVFKAYEEFKQVVDDYVASMGKVETASSSVAAKVGESWMNMDKTIASLGNNEVLSGKVMEHFRWSTEKASTDVVASSSKIASGYKGVSDSAGGAETSTNKVNREFSKLTDITEYAGSGLKKVRNLVEGMAFGAAIGVVSALTEEFISFAKEMVVTEEAIDKLSASVTDQAKAWKILPEPMNAVTQATVDLYNAQLKYLQLLERDKGAELERMVRTLEQVKVTMQDNPEWAGNFGNSIEQIDVKIAEANVKLEQWRQTMGLTTMSVKSVKAGLVDLNKTAEESKRVAEAQAQAYEQVENRISAVDKEIATLTGDSAALLTIQAQELVSIGANTSQLERYIAALERKNQLKDAEDARKASGGDTRKYDQVEGMISSVEMEIVKLTGSKADLLTLEAQEFVSRGANTEQLERYLSALQRKNQLSDEDKLKTEQATALRNIESQAIDGLQDQYLALVETGKFSVSALAKVVADQVKIELTGIAAKASVWAIYETAMGLKDAALGLPTAAGHFAAAAEFATTAGLALAGAAATQAVFGGTATEAAQGTEANPTVTTSSTSDLAATTTSESSTPTNEITINVYNPLDGKIGTDVAQSIIDAINDSGESLNYKISVNAVG